MTAKTTVTILLVAALLIAGAIAMHGRGHQLLARWLPQIHGHR